MKVPAGWEEVFPAESPIVGESSAVDRVVAFTAEVSDECVAFGTRLAASAAQLSAAQSTAARQLRDKVDGTLRTGARILQESVRSARRGCITYAAATEDIYRRARSAQQEVDRLLQVIRTESAVIEGIAQHIRCGVTAAWNSPPSPSMPEPVLDASRTSGMDALEQDAVRRTVAAAHEYEWRRAVTSWIAARDGIARERASWVSLIEERKRAEQALVMTLRDTVLGHLISMGSGPGGPGARYTISHSVAGELWGATKEVPPRIAMAHPDLAALFAGGDASHAWDAPPRPEAVAAWWHALDPAAQDRLVREAPWVIGNLPGLPFAVRDAANREMLQMYARHPDMLAPRQRKVAAELQELLRREAAERVSNPPIQIIAMDLTGAVPKVAVGYGDADSATHTTWAVPGMQSDAHQALAGWDEASRNLFLEQRRVHRGEGSTAVIAWLGYDSPHLIDTLNARGVLHSSTARAGAARFAAELDGERAARTLGEHGVPAVNVVAHSYGTTTVSIGLTLVTYPVDTLTFVASAGLDTQHVPSYDALRVATDGNGQQAIYTTHAAQDLLAPSGAGVSRRGLPNADARGVLGVHASSPVYGGGLAFSSEGDPQRELRPTNGHSIIGEVAKRAPFGVFASYQHGYFDPDTQSLNSIAQITTGSIGAQLKESFVRTDAACVEPRVSVNGEWVSQRRVMCRE